jgi:hypothetical protein
VAISVHKDPQGPDWPLGNIAVPTTGTPVSIMNLVDSAQSNAPETATSGLTDEYTRRAQQIIFQAYKAGAAPPKFAANAGNVYVVRKSIGAGGQNDVGTVIACLTPGQTFILGSAALNRNVYNLYRYFIDADTANDGCQVTAIIQ